MKLVEFSIHKFRSIEDIKITFPANTPVVLFGPNNVGKSNILAALNCMLGERYANFHEFLDSDYFKRNKDKYPFISFTAKFDEYYYVGNSYNPPASTICFTTNRNENGKNEHTYHYPANDNDGKKMYISSDDRERCQVILIDATRDIERQLSYYSEYSILSKFSKKMHAALQANVKDKLSENFQLLKETFESVPEYNEFLIRLQSAFESNVEGFEHKLSIDLSAYDPNNYFKSLRIVADDGEEKRTFHEFGTGEQQILLMSFVKAYAETFKGETFILTIEEPEAHLHPLAQRWLAKNIKNIAKSGIQIVVSTHSPEFLNIEGLEGFVRVFREDGVTKTIQHTAESLSTKCIDMKADVEKCRAETILQFYKTKSFYDQLKGFFGRKILLVEGETEYFALSNYFINCGYDLDRDGIEIVNCRGKTNIMRNYRLFKAYGYKCFSLFDGDSKKGSSEEFKEVFGFDNYLEGDGVFNFGKEYGFFGKDFEAYMRSENQEYTSLEAQVREEYGSDKPLIAKIISETYPVIKPQFIIEIAAQLEMTVAAVASNKEYNEKKELVPDYDDIQF